MHDRGIEYGLNVTNINSGYGVAHQDMHPTKIKHEVAYLGPHEQILGVGDEKHMVFQGGGDGTLFMTPQ